MNHLSIELLSLSSLSYIVMAYIVMAYVVMALQDHVQIVHLSILLLSLSSLFFLYSTTKSHTVKWVLCGALPLFWLAQVCACRRVRVGACIDVSASPCVAPMGRVRGGRF